MTRAVPSSAALVRHLFAFPPPASLFGVHNSTINIGLALNRNLKKNDHGVKRVGLLELSKYVSCHICTCSTLHYMEPYCFPAPVCTLELEDCVRDRELIFEPARGQFECLHIYGQYLGMPRILL